MLVALPAKDGLRQSRPPSWGLACESLDSSDVHLLIVPAGLQIVDLARVQGRVPTGEGDELRHRHRPSLAGIEHRRQVLGRQFVQRGEHVRRTRAKRPLHRLATRDRHLLGVPLGQPFRQVLRRREPTIADHRREAARVERGVGGDPKRRLRGRGRRPMQLVVGDVREVSQKELHAADGSLLRVFDRMHRRARGL